jgi:hypothetical protein
MFLVSRDMASFTAAYQGVGVRDGGGLVEPLPICFAHKRTCACVTAANS